MSNEKGLLFVISAPAGTGKTTLARMLLDEFPKEIVQCTTCTTRLPRRTEIEGDHYYFLTDEQFEKKVRAEEFLEHADVFGHKYGTLKKNVEQELEQGKHVLLVIDTQGAMQLKGHMPAIFIFVKPPSIEELKKRLETRKTEDPEELEKRLKWAKHEMELSDEYDYQIINDHLDNAYKALRKIILKHRR